MKEKGDQDVDAKELGQEHTESGKLRLRKVYSSKVHPVLHLFQSASLLIGPKKHKR